MTKPTAREIFCNLTPALPDAPQKIQLCRDAFAVFYLDAGGEILVEDLRESQPRPARAGIERHGAIRLGAAALGSGLLELLPARPEQAVTCEHCQGRGSIDEFDSQRPCRHCEALGWNLQDVANPPGSAAPRIESESVPPSIVLADETVPPAVAGVDVRKGAAPLDPETFSPHQDYVMIQRWKSWIFVALTAFVLMVATMILGLTVSLNFAALLMLPIDAAVLAFVIWLAIWWPKLLYKHYGYTIRPHGIEIRQGKLWNRTIFIPRSRIQHADVVQGPIERRYDVARLVLHTAGSAAAEKTLYGLRHPHAMRLSQELIASERDRESDRKPVAEPGAAVEDGDAS